jgi:hypothetical protein
MNRILARTVSRPGPRRARTAVVVGIMLLIALVHLFRVGTLLHGPLFTLYYSYFSDVVVPFGLYFLLCLRDDRIPFLAPWRVKGLLVFGVASFTEVMQAFGVPLFGRTFDPLDIAMFGVGVALAAGLDAAILPRVLPGWRGANAERN